MLSCKKAAGLIEKKLNFRLSPFEKMQLYFHTSMCDTCRSYQKQSKDLNTLLEKHIRHNTKTTENLDDVLSEDIKKNIVRELDNNK